MFHSGRGCGSQRVRSRAARCHPKRHVVSASGLTGTDQWHFDLASQRELGRRYAEKMLEVLPLP